MNVPSVCIAGCLRTRLTLAVGVGGGGFLGAAAWLFGSRASDEVLDSARSDQFVVAGVAQAGRR